MQQKKREAVTIPGVNKWTPCLVFDDRERDSLFASRMRFEEEERKKDSIGVSQTFSSSPNGEWQPPLAQGRL